MPDPLDRRLACHLQPGRSLDEAIECARLADRLGYESIWAYQTVDRDPLQVLARYAAVTERAVLGTAVVPIATRHPIQLAMEAATLDEASGGRLRLGIGVSHRLTVEGWYGLALEDPVGWLEEYASVLRELFAHGAVGFEGRHVTARFTFVRYRARRDLPIWFAAMGPRMLRLAARLADGVVLWMCSPGHVREHIRPVLDAALAEAGRSWEEFDLVAPVPVALSEDLAAGRNAFRRAAYAYVQLPYYRKEIAAAGFGEDLEAFDRTLAAAGPADAMAALSDAFVDAYAAVGDAGAARAKIEEYRAAGVTLPSVVTSGRPPAAAPAEAALEALAGA
ncbi:MAG TPA: LLM class flavin-dependent oxidoreductase [Actinomycetota bacterium]|nr:LLM class flavin-dependent oxidoreductase [Actinomycetota bacterium]